MIRILTFIAGLLLSCSLLAGPAVEVQQAWIREAPPTSRVLAGYMSIINTGAVPAEITAISSPDFASAELHQTRVEDGVASMVPIDSITVPAGGRVELEPGGMHLMLFDPGRALQSGDRVRLEVTQSDGATLTVEARVIRDSGGSDSHHHHKH
jgi:copper(I)-binding protein